MIDYSLYIIYYSFIGSNSATDNPVNPLKEMKMATKSKTAQAVEVQFSSVSDIAVQHGQAESKKTACAEYALDNVKGFPVMAEVSEENAKALRDGYSLHHRSIYKPKTYAVIGGQYFEATPDHLANDKVEKINATIDWAMVWTPNEMGTEFKDRPELKKIVEKVRKAHGTYVSDTLGKLVTEGEKILKKRAGIKTERNVVLFVNTVSKFFAAQEKSVKVKQTQRGDATANPEKFKEAVKAFWQVYPHLPTQTFKSNLVK